LRRFAKENVTVVGWDADEQNISAYCDIQKR